MAPVALAFPLLLAGCIGGYGTDRIQVCREDTASTADDPPPVSVEEVTATLDTLRPTSVTWTRWDNPPPPTAIQGRSTVDITMQPATQGFTVRRTGMDGQPDPQCDPAWALALPVNVGVDLDSGQARGWFAGTILAASRSPEDIAFGYDFTTDATLSAAWLDAASHGFEVRGGVSQAYLDLLGTVAQPHIAIEVADNENGRGVVWFGPLACSAGAATTPSDPRASGCW